jgi:hypothetical protein
LALWRLLYGGCYLIALLSARLGMTTPLCFFSAVDAPSTHVQSPLFD